ncbi:MAG: Endonuclease/exonuclease/phosphatase family [Moraxellaceae bacterium]|jgi:predicted extracellular nuclease|nr:Endonuclease/exonuclease/phosphatase family [Moraxellaceae bacterium]
MRNHLLSREQTARRVGARVVALLLALYCVCNGSALARDSDCTPLVREPRPVPVATAGEVVLGTQNLRRLFDDLDSAEALPVDPAEYRERLQRLSRQVVDVLRLPQVLAVQEVENEKVLADLALAIEARSRGMRYRALVLDGHDYGGIDVGFLVRSDWQVLALEQLFAREKLGRAFLFDRPPLLLRVKTPQGDELELVNVHLKSLHGSDRGRKEAKRIARKRQRQTDVLVDWLRATLALRPQARLVVLGDFNAAPEVLGGVDILGRLQAAGLANPMAGLPAAERYTYVHDCRGVALDHVLLSPALQPEVRRLAVSRGNAGASRAREKALTARGSSDHDGVVVYLRR